jgi:hypothetical protein
MAFDPKALRMQFGQGITGASTGIDKIFRQGFYITADLATAVEAASYFNPAADRLQAGNVITAVVGFGTGASQKLKNYIIASNDGTTVVVALQTTTAG